MNHRDLVDRAVRWLQGSQRCSVVFAEKIAQRCSIIPDAIGWRGDWSILVEAKASRSDFFADRRKLIHLDPDAYPGQERWYLTPPGLVRPDEVPDGWGLAEVRGERIRQLRKPPTTPYCASRARHEVGLLGSAVRMHQDGFLFDRERGRFRAPSATPTTTATAVDLDADADANLDGDCDDSDTDADGDGYDGVAQDCDDADNDCDAVAAISLTEDEAGSYSDVDSDFEDCGDTDHDGDDTDGDDVGADNDCDDGDGDDYGGVNQDCDDTDNDCDGDAPDPLSEEEGPSSSDVDSDVEDCDGVTDRDGDGDGYAEATDNNSICSDD